MTADLELQEQIQDLLLRELNKRARTFQSLPGGRNNRVFRVDCDDGSTVAAKAYFQSGGDLRDRMGCEVHALRLLRGTGLREVPAPLAEDPARRIAAFEFVEGEPPRPGDISVADVDRAVAFLAALKGIADSGKARDIPPASEACFSITAIQQNLDARFRRLDEASPGEPDLAEFLHNEIAPCRELAERRCDEICRRHGISRDSDIPLSARTFSPSDFGFHNALRTTDGRLVFLDFEYSGWDDPAKTIADFCLHPGMQLPAELKIRFFQGMTAAFVGVPELSLRVRAVYSLFALKWCAILLNEYTLEDQARRRFAEGGTQEPGRKCAQLEKARRMLAQAKNDPNDLIGHA
jgi:hypothetical protein